jgi:hypothetical protein
MDIVTRGLPWTFFEEVAESARENFRAIGPKTCDDLPHFHPPAIDSLRKLTPPKTSFQAEKSRVDTL